MVVLVLAAELVIALTLRVAVGAPPTTTPEPVSASAVTPIEVPAPPALLFDCESEAGPTVAIRLCQHL